MILDVSNLNKKYKDKILLNSVSFNIDKNDKVSIVGKNGCGKSTLLKILLGIDYPDNKTNDKYEIKINPNIKVGYIDQKIEYSEKISIFEIVKSSVSKSLEEYEIKSILNKLGFDDYEVLIQTLSGGQRRKVALAIALLEDTDLLVLDEPTNHLDEIAVRWLEEYLTKYKGSILLVSHDRYFLNKVTNSIYELENGDLHIYKDVDFDEYLDLKAMRIEENKAQQRKNKAMYTKEKAWISRGVQARRTKSKDRIERFENLKSKMHQTKESPLDFTTLNARIGTKTIELDNISKSYGEKKLFNNFSYEFGRYQRVGILGVNGTGKTTLLKIIAQQLEADNGSVIHGETINIAYFKQTFEFINEDITIIDFINSKAEHIETIYGTISSHKLLETFLFPRSVQHSKISTLSGGEKKRLFLLSELMKGPNVLILDEPTNDFDIETLLVLEEYIENFQGIVIVVSHDRYFLNKVIDDVFIIHNAKVETFSGNYDDYINFYKESIKSSKQKKSKQITSKTKSNKIKFTYDEKKEFETIDSVITKLEEKIYIVDEAIKKNTQDFNKLNELLKERECLEEELVKANDRWFYLNEKNEQINEK